MLKPRKPQMEKDTIQTRDLFSTPAYATELLIPFIPDNIKFVWECACGKGKITEVLVNHGYYVFGSDLGYPKTTDNFLTMDYPIKGLAREQSAIITNPPYSLKRQFFKKCINLGVPFALLLSADYCFWTIEAVRDYGCEKIIPDHRIDYITPTGLDGSTGHTSYFHSFWMTRGFYIGKTETFVTLTKEMKQNI